MKAHAIDCCHGAHGANGARKSPRGWTHRAVGAGVFTVLAALMPKCPMCIAAWLGVVGLAGVATKVDPRLPWIAAALVAAVAGAAIAYRLRFVGYDDTNTGKGTST